MGVTIHYRGTIDEVGQIEELEDRVIDLVFAYGGKATIWRSYSDLDASRVVRGLMIDMAPGLETLCLLFSPEGDLTPPFQIEDAERSPHTELLDCFIKTQFGSVQDHIAIVHLLDAIKQRYCKNLEISDEGDYYETRDVQRLTDKMKASGLAITALADGLNEHGLNKEAAEDPDIVATRIERVAMLVQQKLLKDGKLLTDGGKRSQDASAGAPPDCGDSPTDFSLNINDDGDPGQVLSLEEEVAAMSRIQRKNQLRSERMCRRISEATASGLTPREALELAMKEEGLETPSNRQSDLSPGNEADRFESSQNDEPWRQSLPKPFEETSELDHRETHPSVSLAENFLMGILDLPNDGASHNSFHSIAARGAMDIVGGLVQATAGPYEDRVGRALAITQLKRSLTGHAFARGAVFGLRSAEAISKQTSDQLHVQLAKILETIHELTEAAWDH